jgi:2-methylcitrate synthase
VCCPKDDHGAPGAVVADRLVASQGSMLLYWYHWSATASIETDDDSIGGHCSICSGAPDPVVGPGHTSLILYAEHEFA